MSEGAPRQSGEALKANTLADLDELVKAGGVELKEKPAEEEVVIDAHHQEIIDSLLDSDKLPEKYRGELETTIPEMLKSEDEAHAKQAEELLEAMALKYLESDAEEAEQETGGMENEDEPEAASRAPRSLSAAATGVEDEAEEQLNLSEIVNEGPTWQERFVTLEGQEAAVDGLEESRSELNALVVEKLGSLEAGAGILKPINKEIKKFNRELERLVSIPSENRRADSVEAFRVTRNFNRVMHSIAALTEALKAGRIGNEPVTKTSTDSNEKVVTDASSASSENKQTLRDIEEQEYKQFTPEGQMEEEIEAYENGYEKQIVNVGKKGKSFYDERWSKVKPDKTDKNYRQKIAKKTKKKKQNKKAKVSKTVDGSTDAQANKGPSNPLSDILG